MKKPVTLTRPLIKFILPALWALIICVNSSAAEESAVNNGPLLQAITGGKVDLSVRYRYENVDDDTALKEANASTIRTVLGYTSGNYQGVGMRLALQDVHNLFVDDYNDATGRPGSKGQYAVVADPEATELLEAYLSHNGLQNTTFKLGRQIITYRAAPFHRFMGTVLWRQNWQNHDSLTVENKSIPGAVIRYAYSWNVNRIFTEKAVISSRANLDSDSHFMNIQYNGFKFANIEAYTYLLDFENAAASSSATYGGRLNGAFSVAENYKLIYTAEYALQKDYGNQPARLDEDYILGELGVNAKFGTLIDSLTLKVGYELLSGDGLTSFQTPLATGHAFQGWADRFLVTPRDGIEDVIITAVAKAFGMNFIAAYHMLSADSGGYDYGDELDILASRGINKNLSVGAKYSVYNADRNTLNIARNGAIAADVSKLWVWVEFKF